MTAPKGTASRRTFPFGTQQFLYLTGRRNQDMKDVATGADDVMVLDDTEALKQLELSLDLLIGTTFC